jgi:hypothetical protein
MTRTHEPQDGSDSVRRYGVLADLCRRVHDLLYVQDKSEFAEQYVPRMERILGELPSDSRAIIYWESSALVAELQGRIDEAAEFRRREIALMLELHQLVEDGKDDPSVLVGRELACLESRRKILCDLLEKCDEDQNRP